MALGALLHTFSYSYNDLDPRIDMSRHDLKLIAAYNWHATPTGQEKNSKITIPGAPALLHPKKSLKLPIFLSPDNQSPTPLFRNQNIARARWPMQPLFRAVGALAQDTHIFEEQDYILDRNILRSLFKIIKGQYNDYREGFAVQIQRVGNTLIMKRLLDDSMEALTMANQPGYGASFENAVASYPDSLHDAVSYHTIVTYTLRGRKFMVRAEADSALETADFRQAGESTFRYNEAASFEEDRNDLDLPDLNKLVELKSGRYVEPAQIFFGGLSLAITGCVGRGGDIRDFPMLHEHTMPVWGASPVKSEHWPKIESIYLQLLVRTFDQIKSKMLENDLEHARLVFPGFTQLQLYEIERSQGVLPMDDIKVAFPHTD